MLATVLTELSALRTTSESPKVMLPLFETVPFSEYIPVFPVPEIPVIAPLFVRSPFSMTKPLLALLFIRISRLFVILLGPSA